MKNLSIKALLILLFFSFPSLAETGTEAAPAAAATPQTLGVVAEKTPEEKITLINQEIKNLDELQKKATGQDKTALQLYMFRKNLDVRKVIEDNINSASIDKAFFTQQVESQQKDAKMKAKLLAERVNDLNAELNKVTDDKKLSIVTQLQEIQFYLDEVYQEKEQNIKWLKQLGIDMEKEYALYVEEINIRLEQIAANIEYLKQRTENQNLQLQGAPETEKETINFARTITKKEMSISTSSLESILDLADALPIETAQYKRLLFEVTGNVTQDLLNKDVLSSIIDDWLDKAWDTAIKHTPQMLFQLLIILLILFIAHQLAKLARKILTSMLGHNNLNMSKLMQDFFVGMSGKIVYILGILIALAQVGIDLGPVLAGLGIAGVIIGFALQDILSNFAAGMMLLIYRPFDVGDFVYAGGVDGKVSHMSLVNTTIKTFDNQIIIVPNTKIWGDVIKNVTQELVRRVDMVFGVSYDDDIETVEKIFLDIVTSHPAVLKAPEPMIKVGELADSSVNFLVRPWVKTDDYWDVYWDVTREVKIRFDKEGISIPYPQQDVHFYHGVEKAQYAKNSQDIDLDYDKIVKQ